MAQERREVMDREASDVGNEVEDSPRHVEGFRKFGEAVYLRAPLGFAHAHRE